MRAVYKILSHLRRDKIVQFVIVWMELGGVMLNKVSEKERDTFFSDVGFLEM